MCTVNGRRAPFIGPNAIQATAFLILLLISGCTNHKPGFDLRRGIYLNDFHNNLAAGKINRQR